MSIHKVNQGNMQILLILHKSIFFIDLQFVTSWKNTPISSVLWHSCCPTLDGFRSHCDIVQSAYTPVKEFVDYSQILQISSKYWTKSLGYVIMYVEMPAGI